jgi:hypothetical protein
MDLILQKAVVQIEDQLDIQTKKKKAGTTKSKTNSPKKQQSPYSTGGKNFKK